VRCAWPTASRAASVGYGAVVGETATPLRVRRTCSCACRRHT